MPLQTGILRRIGLTASDLGQLSQKFFTFLKLARFQHQLAQQQICFRIASQQRRVLLHHIQCHLHLTTAHQLPRDLQRFARLALAFQRERPEVRREFWKTVGVLARKNPRALKPVVTIAALYAHLGPFSQYVLGAIDQQIADVEAGRWQVPVPVPVPVRAAPGEMAEMTTAR
jgi:hypothetical protein